MKTAILVSIISILASTNAILNGELFHHEPYYARVTYRLVDGNQQVTHERAGAIIADRFILTTGAFMANAWDYRAWVGSHIRASQQSHVALAMIRVSTHPDGPAILQLATPLTFSPTVQSIRIVPSNSIMGAHHEQGLVLGMGGLTAVTRANIHAAFMRIIPSSDCLINYPSRDMNAHFCAFDSTDRSDFCPEDRGSAFTVVSRGEEFLVGIAVDSVCNIIPHDRPSLFARISFFRDRINEILDGLQIPSV